MSTGSRSGVYPRLCGGTLWHCPARRRGCGLSPPVRGNLVAGRHQAGHRRSIPACAGEPWWSTADAVRPWVYPRLCGGTLYASYPDGPRWGLSPPVRGNLSQTWQYAPAERSIPACAGEPSRAAAEKGLSEVYPRLCGGTEPLEYRAVYKGGLSPPVRGNRKLSSKLGLMMGSIPACAGEPWMPPCPPKGQRVYPRLCGGTTWPSTSPRRWDGLSPPVRGNRRRTAPRPDRRGSIPACAGEPLATLLVLRAGRVYPRLCGGTGGVCCHGKRPPGLSPPVRGNQRAGVAAPLALRSIPACAGEPRPVGSPANRTQVYPRLCGGTAGRGGADENLPGLSPPVRGNLGA